MNRRNDSWFDAAKMPLLLVVPTLGYMIGTMIGLHCVAVGGREQSSTEVATATASAPSSSALVPAPTTALSPRQSTPRNQEGCSASRCDGEGEDGVPVQLSDLTVQLPEPASTVTQSALTATATVVTVIDPVPATPPAVSTHPYTGPDFAPWPVELWPMVECLIERESRGDPSVTGAQGERGLMQIGPANFAYLAERGISPASLYDGPTNIRSGWLLYLYWQEATGDGWRPWASTRGGCA